jgi:hypothetical protein
MEENDSTPTDQLLHSIDVYASQLEDALKRNYIDENPQNEIFISEIKCNKNLSLEIVDQFIHLLRCAQKIFDNLTYCENLTTMKVGKTLELSTLFVNSLLDLTLDVVYEMRAFVAYEKATTTQNVIKWLEKQGSYLQNALQDLRSEENISRKRLFSDPTLRR